MVTKFAAATIALLKQHIFTDPATADDRIAALPSDLAKCGLALIPAAHDPRTGPGEREDTFTIEMNVQEILAIAAATDVYCTCVLAVMQKKNPQLDPRSMDPNLAEAIRQFSLELMTAAGFLKQDKTGKIITLGDPAWPR